MKFGDDSCVDINGKGSILFLTKTGEHRLLFDMYFIHSLRSNTISLGQTTENGCDVYMKGEYLSLHDDALKVLMRV